MSRLLSIVLAALLACSCAAQDVDARVRSALDVLADVIDPASELAAQGCIAAQETEVSEAEAGRTTAAQAGERIQRIRVRCRALRDAFDAMRTRHDQARRLVEQGALEQAGQVVEEIRAEWRQISGGAP